ncbi:glycosyltransferase [Hydrogenimonas sp.]
MKTNLHVSLTNIKNESRLFKEVTSLANHRLFDRIIVAGLHEEGLAEQEYLNKKVVLDRFVLKTRRLSRSLPFQLLKYVEFASRVLTKYRDENVETVTVHMLALLPVGVLYKKMHGAKLVYDAHEYETERNGLAGLRKKLSKLVERWLIPYCDATIVVSGTIADEYKKLYPKLERPSVVLNTPFYKKVEKKDIFRKKLNIDEDRKIFLYQGALGTGRGIETLLEAFKKPIAEAKNGLKPPVIIFMGYGPLEIEIKKAAKKYDNIFFHEAVSPDILLEYTGSADAGISMIEDCCLSYRYCLPNKIFEYMMVDIPVIVSDLPEMKRVVEENGVGVVAESNSVEGLREAVRKVCRMDMKLLRENIQRVKDVYNWQEQEKTLLKIYNEL